MRFAWAACAFGLLLLMRSSAWAQQLPPQLEAEDSAVQRIHHAWTPLRVAKWSVLAGSAATAIYGFSQNRSADRAYARIETLCKQSPAQCARTSTDAYADAALEQRYQNILSQDKHARTALLAGQVGLAASVVLFILDMHDDAAPRDIPYEPRQLQLGFRRDGVELQFRKRTR